MMAFGHWALIMKGKICNGVQQHPVEWGRLAGLQTSDKMYAGREGTAVAPHYPVSF